MAAAMELQPMDDDEAPSDEHGPEVQGTQRSGYRALKALLKKNFIIKVITLTLINLAAACCGVGLDVNATTSEPLASPLLA